MPHGGAHKHNATPIQWRTTGIRGVRVATAQGAVVAPDMADYDSAATSGIGW